MLTRALLKELKFLKELNQHTDAYILAAKQLGLPQLVEQLRVVQADQARRGELSHNMYHHRFQLYEQLLAEAKKVLSPGRYRALYRCF